MHVYLECDVRAPLCPSALQVRRESYEQAVALQVSSAPLEGRVSHIDLGSAGTVVCCFQSYCNSVALQL